MPCRNCPKKANPGKGTRKVGAWGPGTDVKLKYLGDSKKLLGFEGPATREEYVVGGRINLITADSRDLSTGVSWAPGLLEMTDEKGAKLFEIHVPLKEEMEAEAEAKARVEEAWETAEALALPQEESEPAKPRQRKTKAEEPDEGALPGD